MAYVEATTLGDLCLRAADRHGDRPAVVFPERTETFREIADGALAVARGLVALGVEQGDHVGILMPNCLDMIHALFGAALAGAVVCPVNARYKSHELGYVIENARHRVLLTSDVVDEHVDYPSLLHEALPGLADGVPGEPLTIAAAPDLRHVVLLGRREVPGMIGRPRFQELAATVEPTTVDSRRAHVRVRDAGIVLYTSGTTANPKGCLLTHEAIVRSALAMGAREEATAADVWWDPLPLFHTSGLEPLMVSLDVGGLFLCMTHFEPGGAVKQIREHGATIVKSIFLPVTMALVNHPDFGEVDVEKVRFVAAIGPADTLRLVKDAFPRAVIEGAYGLAECAGYVATNGVDDTTEQQLHTVGTPYPGITIRALDPETGELLPYGTPGELCVKGFVTMEGYYRDPVHTAEALPGDGWLHTGDRGRIREDGRIEFLGRFKEMIRVGGENVGPAEIEGYLSTHHAVHLVQAVGVPDPRYEEVVAVFVELKPGTTATEQELIEFSRGRISTFKVPRYVRIVDEWPMSATKIQRFRLRDALVEELGLAPPVAADA
jgi:acyl-CoA synthetase (AMP-forming)/AMP-acid ligase II